jgi:hypothetical protein
MISTGTHNPVFSPLKVIKVIESLLHWKRRGAFEFF